MVSAEGHSTYDPLARGSVDEMSSNGVTFEQVDQGPIKTDVKSIATLGDSKTAWFKDPDRNTLGPVQA